MRFKVIREAALYYWQAGTWRECYLDGDDISSAYECDWQNRHDKHVSIFCSLGDWASCLSQLLLDERHDNVNIDSKVNTQQLYLYYNQVLLVASEIFSDIEKMYREANKISDQKVARKRMSGNAKLDLHQLIGFINNIVKHKINGFHGCNHHLSIRFSDSKNTRRSKKSIYVGNIENLSNKTSIYVPSLISIVESVIASYYHLNETFENDSRYKIVARKYEQV